MPQYRRIGPKVAEFPELTPEEQAEAERAEFLRKVDNMGRGGDIGSLLKGPRIPEAPIESAMRQRADAPALEYVPGGAPPVAVLEQPPAGIAPDGGPGGKFLDVGQDPPAFGSMFGGAGIGAGPSTMPISAARRVLSAAPGRLEAVTQAGKQRVGKAAEHTQRAQKYYMQEQADTARAKADVMASSMVAVDAVRAKYQEAETRADEQVQKERESYKQAMDRYKSLEIDPSRRFQGASKVGAAIAMALGAMGTAMGGGDNTAFRIIQGEIDRDIRAQEAEISKAGQAVDMSRTAIGMARDALTDTRAQKLAAENMHWLDAERKLELTTQEHAAPEVAAKAEMLHQQMRQKIAENDAEIDRTLEETKARLAGTNFNATVAEHGVKERSHARRAAQQGKAAKAKAQALAGMVAPPDLAVIDPQYQMSASEAQKKDNLKAAQKMTSSYNNVRAHLQELLIWRSKHGAKMIPGAELDKGRAIQGRALKAILKHDDAGANVSELERVMTGLFENVNDFGWYKDKIKTLMHLSALGTVEGMRPYNYTLESQATKRRGRKISK